MNICVFNIRENNPFIGGVERVSYTLISEWAKYTNVICISAIQSRIEVSYQSLCPEFFLPNSNILSQENIDFVISKIKQYKIHIIINQGSVFEDLCNLCYTIRKECPVKLVTAVHYAPNQMNIAAENNFFIKLRVNSWKKCLKECLLFCNYYLRNKRKFKKHERLSIRTIAHNSDSIVILSQYYMIEYARYISRKDREKISIIPNPLEEIKENLKFPAKKNQIIYVGRLEYGLKRVDRLLLIWEKIAGNFPQWNFVVVGDGGIRKELENYVEKKRIPRIHFAGFQNPDSYYLESAILCMSSSSEGFAMVLLEAQKNYCVPIAYDSFGAVEDIISSGKTGEIVSSFDENEYMKKLMHLMRDTNYREMLAKEAYLSVTRYKASTIAKQWILLFEKLK